METSQTTEQLQLETEALFDVLEADVRRAWEALFAEGDAVINDQYLRRTTVRTVVAFLEGAYWELRVLASEHPEMSSRLSADQQKKLLNKRYPAGPVETFKFAHEVFSRTYGVNEPLDDSSQAWQEFTSTIEVRNRLSHPKIAGELTVTDLELAYAIHTYLYSRVVFRRLIFFGLIARGNNMTVEEMKQRAAEYASNIAATFLHMRQSFENTLNSFRTGIHGLQKSLKSSHRSLPVKNIIKQNRK